MTQRPLFAYGTLQDSDILAAVLGRAVRADTLVAAILPGFLAVYYPGRVYPALLASPGAATEGRLIEGLCPKDWAGLDAFEGDEYRRETLDVMTPNGPISADLYLPTQPIPFDAKPWTLADWLLHHKPAVLASEVALAKAAHDEKGGM